MAERTRNAAEAVERRLPRDIWPMVLYLGAVSAVAAVGSIATRGGQDWYETLEKPAFNPPDWTFGVVWTVLYTVIAVAAWLVHRGSGVRTALTAWWVQLGLNLAWTWLFFGFELPGWALLEIGLLIVAILWTIALFWRKNRTAAVMLVPYLGWVGFAAALNFEIWRLN